VFSVLMMVIYLYRDNYCERRRHVRRAASPAVTVARPATIVGLFEEAAVNDAVISPRRPVCRLFPSKPPGLRVAGGGFVNYGR